MFKSIVYPKLDLTTLQTWWSEHSQATSPLAIKYVAQCDSTNAQLYRSAHQHNTLLVAEQQSHGKGQFERAWVSQAGDLIFSIGLLLPVAQLTALSLRVGLALQQAFEKSNLTTQLKWANDVIATHPDTGQRGKLAGVLVQTLHAARDSAWVVIGVGVNVAARILPHQSSAFAPMGLAQLSETWGSPAVGQRDALLMQLVDAVVLAVETEPAHNWLDAWNACDVWRDAPVELIDPQGVAHQGRAAGVNDLGAYMLNNDKGDLMVFHSGQLRARA